MTNRFYHGGHIGDCIYALYTVMKMGGGEVYIGPYDHGAWGPPQWEALLPLVKAQLYVTHAEVVSEKPANLTYDFTRTWTDLDPYVFWEWHGDSIPGNINLKKRDFINCGLRNGWKLPQMLMCLQHDQSWLSARRPPDDLSYDIVVHAPMHKMTRDREAYERIFIALKDAGASIAMIGDSDVDQWGDSTLWDVIKPGNLLVAADMIGHCKLFMGTASCCYVIAEGLDKFRLADIFQPAEGAVPMNERGWDTSGWSEEKIIRAARTIIRQFDGQA